ncbi:hypothetical protein D7Y05_07960 [bacterium 1XD42-54]|nr:hypothetical protein D7Y05_07960 [bacterium 1XD42-54]
MFLYGIWKMRLESGTVNQCVANFGFDKKDTKLLRVFHISDTKERYSRNIKRRTEDRKGIFS